MERTIEWRSRIRLVDEVAQELRDRIYSGEYGPGEPLRQEQLADDLRVSRTPLREALRMLEQEGLVDSEPGRGVRVASADIRKLLAAYQVREVLDGLAARLAAGSPDLEGRAALERMIDAQREALEPWQAGRYTLANVEFHTAVVALADNDYLAAQLPVVRMTSQVFTPGGLIEPEHAAAAVAQHGEIARAIAEGDGHRAEHLARAHIRSTIARLSRSGDT